MYVVFLDGQKQLKAAVGEAIRVDYRETAQAGTTLEFDQVLLCAGGTAPVVGSPYIPDAKVVAIVQEHEQGPKIYVQHMRRRKDSRRRIGHRQKYTRVVIQDIVVPGVSVTAAAPPDVSPAAPPAAPPASGPTESPNPPETPTQAPTPTPAPGPVEGEGS